MININLLSAIVQLSVHRTEAYGQCDLKLTLLVK